MTSHPKQPNSATSHTQFRLGEEPLTCLRSELLDNIPGLAHGFFTRHGGISPPPFDSLNGSFHVGDTPAHVAHNRLLMLRHAGFKQATDFITLTQVHGTTIHTVTEDWQTLTTPLSSHSLNDLRSPAFFSPQGDALITQERDKPLGILTADCCCLLMADAQTKLIAAAHVGWRGVQAGLIAKLTNELTQHGAKLRTLHVVVGPCIPAASYPVGSDFLRLFPEAQAWSFRCGETLFFDLQKAIIDQLKVLSLYPCEVLQVLTDEDRFFSFRRNQRTGRCLSFIGWLAT